MIDQAKGIIMAANRVNADEAFELLVQRSQQGNLKLKDLASRFINDIIRSDT